MVFARYFVCRYVSLFFILTLLLALVFNVIEFFEKLMRMPLFEAKTIFYFVCLNFLPSFSDLMPVGSWLAAGFLLWELHQKNEWETIFMLSIGYKNLLRLFAFSGFLAMIAAFFIHEGIVIPVTAQSIKFKRDKLRRGQQGLLINKSFMIKGDLFCSVGFLDIDAGIGSDLLFVWLSDQFILKQIVSIPVFTIDTDQKKIMYKKGTCFNRLDQAITHVVDRVEKIPGFFVKIGLQDQAPLLVSLVKTLVAQQAVLAQEIIKEIWYLILQRLFFYLQIFLCPIMTFLFFILTEKRGSLRWFLLLLPYPLLMALAVMIGLLHQSMVATFLLIFAYAIFVLLVFLFLFVVLRKKCLF